MASEHFPHEHIVGLEPYWMEKKDKNRYTFDYSLPFQNTTYNKSALTNHFRFTEASNDLPVSLCKQPEEDSSALDNQNGTVTCQSYHFSIVSPSDGLFHGMSSDMDYPYVDIKDDKTKPCRTLKDFGQLDHKEAVNSVFLITKNVKMPEIPVTVKFVNTLESPQTIHWRLAVEYKLSRYRKKQSGLYEPTTYPIIAYWQGTVNISQVTPSPLDFKLFSKDDRIQITHSPEDPELLYGDFVLGGHAVLSVAVSGGDQWFGDFRHLLIGGENPNQTEIKAFVKEILNVEDDPETPTKPAHFFYHLVLGIFGQESVGRQFSNQDPNAKEGPRQTGLSWEMYPITKREECKNKCYIKFSFPGDPPDYPIVGFDFGIGISQWTWLEVNKPPTARICWNWKENVLNGICLLLTKVDKSIKDIENLTLEDKKYHTYELTKKEDKDYDDYLKFYKEKRSYSRLCWWILEKYNNSSAYPEVVRKKAKGEIDCCFINKTMGEMDTQAFADFAKSILSGVDQSRKHAIMNFQKRFELKQDGKVGTDTHKAINEANAVAGYWPPLVFKSIDEEQSSTPILA